MPVQLARRLLQLESLEERHLLAAFVDAGTLVVTGTARNDLILIAPSGSDVVATVNNQSMTFPASSVSALYIDGRAGNDRIYVNDAVTLDATIHGGLDNDRIVSGSGNDTLFGEQGKDRIKGGGGNDRIWCGVGNDSCSGDVGNDELFGDAGNDHLDGDFGGDNLHGGAGKDVLHGGASDDWLDGDTGIDALFGDDGDDMLVNHLDHDKLRAGPINHVYIPPFFGPIEGLPTYQQPQFITYITG